MFELVPLTADHLLAIEAQPSQRMQFGIPADLSLAEARDAVAAGEAYALLESGRVLACLGIIDSYEPGEGMAWAILTADMGAGYLFLSRFARHWGNASALRTIRAHAIAPRGLLTLDAVLRHATPEMRWLALLGMRPVQVLPNFGAARETLVLFERHKLMMAQI